MTFTLTQVGSAVSGTIYFGTMAANAGTATVTGSVGATGQLSATAVGEYAAPSNGRAYQVGTSQMSGAQAGANGNQMTLTGWNLWVNSRSEGGNADVRHAELALTRSQ